MTRTISGNVINRLVDALNDANSEGEVEEFGRPILGGCWHRAREQREGMVVGSKLDAIEGSLGSGQELPCHRAVHEQRLCCVTNRRTLHLRVHDDIDCDV